MKKIITYIFCIILTISSTISQASEESIAIIVGEKVISTYDLRSRAELSLFSIGIENTPEITSKLLPQIVKSLIDEKLYEIEAEKYNIEVTESDLDVAMRNLEEKNGLEYGSLKEFIESKNIEFNAIKNQLEAQLLWNRILQKIIRPKVIVTDKEIEEAMENLSSITGQAQLNISEIVLPVENEKDKDQVLYFADKLVDQIRKGKKFEAIAREFSRSTTAANGGNLGWVEQGQIDKGLLVKFKNLAVGQISDPIYVQDGYYIVKLNDRRAIVSSSEDETEVGLKQAFIPWDNELSDKQKLDKLNYVQKLANKVQGCEDFDKFAQKAKSNISNDMQMLQLKSLNKRIKANVKNAPVGFVGPLMDSEEGIHTFIVCERTKAVNSFANRQKIEETLYNKKIELESKKYLRNLKRSTFIEIRL